MGLPVNSERKNHYERNYSFCVGGGGPIDQSKIDVAAQEAQAPPIVASTANNNVPFEDKNKWLGTADSWSSWITQ